MSPYAPPLDAEALRAIYPESDGKRMSDNMVQARWIFLFYGNLIALLADRPDAFVAADNLWYPVEGKPKLRVAPDVYVVFGRPKGDRGSYMQWLEGDVPLTVAVEILSPRNTKKMMAKKLRFYDRHGVEEYYVYDPDDNTLEIYTRDGGRLRRQRDIAAFVSPRLGIRFEMTQPEMTVYGPKGRQFLSFDELERQAEEAKRRADANAKRADDNARLVLRVTELSRKFRRGQATPEEVAELDRLEGDLP